MTQRERLEMALVRHGCTQVATTAKGSQWTEGNLVDRQLPRDPDGHARFFFIGNNGGFRHGRSRSNSVAWERTRARLLAEPPIPATASLLT